MKKPFFRIDPSLFLLPFLFWKMPPGDLLIFLSAVLLHEAGHLACASLLGYRTRGILLSLSGAKIFLFESLIPYKKEILIFLSGPLTNLLFCIPGFFLLRWHFTRMGVLFFFSHLLLALFNLLPLPGLDGEGALSSFLSLYLDPETRDEKMTKIRKITFVLFLLFALLFLIGGNNPSLFFLCFSLSEEKKTKKATNNS